MRNKIAVSLSLMLQCAAVSAVCAGDVANLEILGFSKDGRVFAFEEYGVADGSGFPYANRYYVDTETDAFLPNTPVRARIEDEGASLDRARLQARERGDKIVPGVELAANKGFTAGFNAVTELSADPFRMLVNPRPIFSPVDPPLEIRLEEIPRNDTEHCAGFGEINGFRLLMIDARDGGQTRLLHEDQAIPQSRGCPNGYRIGAIQVFEYKHSLEAYAVVIAVRTYGFEGPDFRWIAVTGRW